MSAALSIKVLGENISNSFIGLISEMYETKDENLSMDENEEDSTIRFIMKENRYMYLALMILLLIIIGNLFF